MIAHDHGENASTVPDSKELIQQHASDNVGVAPPLHDTKPRCPEPPITQQPLPFKTSSFTQIYEVCRSLNPHTLARKVGSFQPCQL
jgi:hypothetical protein